MVVIMKNTMQIILMKMNKITSPRVYHKRSYTQIYTNQNTTYHMFQSLTHLGSFGLTVGTNRVAAIGLVDDLFASLKTLCPDKDEYLRHDFSTLCNIVRVVF